MPKKDINQALQIISAKVRSGADSDSIIKHIIENHTHEFLENVHKFINLPRQEQLKLVEFNNISFIVTNIVILKEILDMFTKEYLKIIDKKGAGPC